MKILLFAGLAEAAGQSTVDLSTMVILPVRVAELKAAISEAYPSTKELLGSCFAAINQSYADDEAYVQEGDEVAFIPPVSGG